MAADMPDAVQKSVVLFPKHCTQKTHDLKTQQKQTYTDDFWFEVQVVLLFLFSFGGFLLSSKAVCFCWVFEVHKPNNSNFLFFLNEHKNARCFGFSFKK